MTSQLADDRVIQPQEPRIYDYLLGGKNNSDGDRALGDALVLTADWLPRAAQINRAYGARTVAHMARNGIAQFLDLGCGYPPPPCLEVPDTHEVVTWVRPDATVICVDHDPVVATHARALRAGRHHEHGVECVDIHKIRDLLAAPEAQRLDWARPIGVLLNGMLEWIPDDAEVHQLLADLRDLLPAGSAISINHSTGDMRPDEARDVVALYEQHGLNFRPRSEAKVRALLAPLAPRRPRPPAYRLVAPGFAVRRTACRPIRGVRRGDAPPRPEQGPPCPVTSSFSTCRCCPRASNSVAKRVLPTAPPWPAHTARGEHGIRAIASHRRRVGPGTRHRPAVPRAPHRHIR
ncbi:SAM-dependent methyltransferase [Streptomyces kronopolitis]|uniref:SAM-dependent methyltransferase n=1 Tax=Streptomyces kronopolitis TaxID=1612435 RepID=UPI003D95EFAA